MNKCELVRSTCAWVSSLSKHVKINNERISALAQVYLNKPQQVKFTEDHHESLPDDESTLKQFFILDSLNFCFWPLEGFEYHNLASHIKQCVHKGISLESLMKITEEQLIENIFQGVKISQADQRARILREMAFVTLNKFGGSFTSIIVAANKSAVRLLEILTQNYPNFQDHSIYKGKQVHFYKRAQILIADISGKFQGKGLGYFTDIHELTMFPDYRVPQTLHEHGVFEYSEELKKLIYEKEQITDRHLQIEIRANSVVAVELLKKELKDHGKDVHSIELDWFLWKEGEDNLSTIKPNHRVLTIYY